MVTYTLTCYGTPYDVAENRLLAKRRAEKHIRACPYGAMPWALNIEWHSTDEGILCSAAKGEWLDHHLKPEVQNER